MKIAAKRIVNIYNFIRAIEPRIPAVTPDVLRATTERQIELVAKHRLPATFALQYDALMDVRYQDLLRRELDPQCEIGAWWEIVEPLVRKAGLVWRGRFPWDWHAHVGFSTGYTPREREKLVDVYMADFKDVFGAYPQTVGSWFIDTHSLRYMSDRYGIVASCNCKDQVGTDGYTLWGGYWNQGYYPSRENVFVPAQSTNTQIPVPVFRMLGSDPIYQYDNGLGTLNQAVVSLEPVYPESGGNREWVEWFFRSMTEETCLAFAYAQAGQENSFTWERMARGFELQIEHISALAAAGKLSVQTLAQTGQWFRSHFQYTPATAVVATDDWKHEGRQTVWYNSRFYRANLLREPDGFRVRDIHIFDERYPDPYLDVPLESSSCHYDTLPVMDGFHWSRNGYRAGIRIVDLSSGSPRPLQTGPFHAAATPRSGILVSCPVVPSGRLEIECAEREMVFRFKDMPENVRCALSLSWSKGAHVPFERIEPHLLVCSHKGYGYQIACSQGHFQQDDGHRQQSEDSSGVCGILMIPERDIFGLKPANG